MYQRGSFPGGSRSVDNSRLCDYLHTVCGDTPSLCPTIFPRRVATGELSMVIRSLKSPLLSDLITESLACLFPLVPQLSGWTGTQTSTQAFQAQCSFTLFHWLPYFHSHPTIPSSSPYWSPSLLLVSSTLRLPHSRYSDPPHPAAPCSNPNCHQLKPQSLPSLGSS